MLRTQGVGVLRRRRELNYCYCCCCRHRPDRCCWNLYVCPTMISIRPFVAVSAQSSKGCHSLAPAPPWRRRPISRRSTGSSKSTKISIAPTSATRRKRRRIGRRRSWRCVRSCRSVRCERCWRSSCRCGRCCGSRTRRGRCWRIDGIGYRSRRMLGSRTCCCCCCCGRHSRADFDDCRVVSSSCCRCASFVSIDPKGLIFFAVFAGYYFFRCRRCCHL